MEENEPLNEIEKVFLMYSKEIEKKWRNLNVRAREIRKRKTRTI